MNEEAQEVKKVPLKVAPGLSSRLSGSYRVSKETGIQVYSDEDTTLTWRPHKCQVGVIRGREKSGFKEEQDLGT